MPAAPCSANFLAVASRDLTVFLPGKTLGNDCRLPDTSPCQLRAWFAFPQTSNNWRRQPTP
eukprot:3509636-Lingulodinium_polyedra.AAC.1